MPKYVNPKRVKIAGAAIHGVMVAKRQRMSKSAIKGVGSAATQQYIKVTGVDRLVSMFAALPGKVQKRILRPVLREEGKIVLRRAKSRVPKDADGHQLPDGKHLRQTLKLQVTKPRNKHELSMKIRTGTRRELGIPQGEKGYYPSALEYGGLAWQPMPYMRPAYEQTKDLVMKSAEHKIAQGVAEIVRHFQ